MAQFSRLIFTFYLFTSLYPQYGYSWSTFSYYRKNDGACNINENEGPLIFKQKLNHFAGIAFSFWDQKYFSTVNSPSNEIMFLMLGLGNDGVSPDYSRRGLAFDLAKQCSANYIFLQHRFYGDDAQIDVTLTLDNLKKYLTIEQAANDVKYFITETKKSTFSKITKWILFGEGYFGSVAAWTKGNLKDFLPLHGAVSFSAPNTPRFDFHEYFSKLIENLKLKPVYGTDCYNNLKEIFKQIIKADKKQLDDLVDGDYDPLNPYEKTFMFIYWIKLIGYNIEQGPEDMCSKVTQKTLRSLSLLGGSGCIAQPKSWKKYLEKLRIVSLENRKKGLSDGSRYWRQMMFHQCYQLGLFQTLKPETFGFEIKTNDWINICKVVFEDKDYKPDNNKKDKIYENYEENIQASIQTLGRTLTQAQNTLFVSAKEDKGWNDVQIISLPRNSNNYIFMVQGGTNYASDVDAIEMNSEAIKTILHQMLMHQH